MVFVLLILLVCSAAISGFYTRWYYREIVIPGIEAQALDRQSERYQEGYENGHLVGYKDGSYVGYSEGYSDGSDEGYQIGYFDGCSYADNVDFVKIC